MYISGDKNIPKQTNQPTNNKLKSFFRGIWNILKWLFKAFLLWVFFMILNTIGFWEWLQTMLNMMFS